MKYQIRAATMVGLVLLGVGVIASGQAIAYGPQWRPIDPPPNAMQQQAAAAANAVPGGPVFRPASMPRNPFSYANPYTYSAYGPAAYAPAYPYRGRSDWRARAPAVNMPMAGMGYQPRAYQPPVFTQQYGWRAAPQPWIADRAMYPGQMFHTPFDAYQQMYPASFAWANPFAGPQPVAYGGSQWPGHSTFAGYYPDPRWLANGYAAAMSRYPSAWSNAYGWGVPGGQWPMPQMAMANPWSPSRAAPQSYGYRGMPQPQPWLGRMAFRPPVYGTESRAAYTAETSRNEEQFTRDNLPGWVTTYQESEQLDYCAWCGGS